MLYLFLLSLFSTLIMFPVNSASENMDVYADGGQPVTQVSPTPAEWTCKINKPCLNQLNNILLNKEDNRGIYQYCQITYENNKLCCVDFNQCQESWEESPSGNLDANNLPDVSQEALDSCELNQLSPLLSFLSGIQDQYCTQAVKHCKKSCKNKLEEVKQAFRQCFFVPSDTSIDKIMQKVSTSQAPTGQENCYQEIKKVAKKYKDQSLEKDSLLRNDLEAKDVIKCEEIKQAQTPQSLRDLTLNMCHNFKAERQEEKEKQKELERQRELKKQQELERKKQLEEQAKKRAEQRKKAQQAKASLQAKKPTASASKALLGAGAIAATKTKTTSPAKKRKKVTKKTPTKKPTSLNPSSAKKAKSNTVADSSKNQDSFTARQNKSSFNSSRRRSHKERLRERRRKLLRDRDNILSENCPISMPEIKQAVVFQSVEAPQIEPMEEQAHPPYDNYDLVWNKPAGILVEIDPADMDYDTEFHLATIIFDNFDYIDKCFHEPFEETMLEGSEKECYFKLSDLKEKGIYKFFPLPMSTNFLRDREKVKIITGLFPKDDSEDWDCLKTKSFNINTIETGKLRLSWARLKSKRKKCDYKATPFSRVKEFANSDEVLKRIPSMFPITGVKSKAVQSSSGKDYIDAECNDDKAVSYPKVRETLGLLSDIDLLEQIRSVSNYDKIFAVVPGEYFRFHDGYYKNRKDSNYDMKYAPAGMMLPPSWEPAINTELANLMEEESEGMNLGGSWNVAFVRDDQVDTGTVSHELGHTLGQGRELYHTKERCRHFKEDTRIQCRENRIIPKFLHTGKENNKTFWGLSDRKKYTIMDSQPDITEQWIDRDTYQKNLWAIVSNLGFVINPWRKLFQNSPSSSNLERPPRTLKVIVSGFYYEDEKAFVNPKIKVRKTRLSTKSFYPKTENTMIPVVIFQLKERKRVLKEIKRLILKSEMELLYRDRPSIKRPFPFSHAMATFNLPADYRNRNLRIVVLDPWKKPIYSSSVPKEITGKSSISKK